MSEHKLTTFELKSVAALSSVLVLRMLGLFMILPVFALHAGEFSHSTPFLIGVALGIYGLTQALFQVPFGAASDRWGRKPLMLLGLLIFAAGSVIAAESSSIYGVIVGRALQGAGTIAAVVLAMVGDLIRESQRPKSMAIVGASIGSAFTLSLMLGPVLDHWLGIQGLFWLAFGLAVAGMMLVLIAVPGTDKVSSINLNESSERVSAFSVIFDRRLLLLYSGTLSIHAVMTALFLAFPVKFIEVSGFNRNDMWEVFVPVLLASFLVMFGFIRYSTRKKRTRGLMLLAGLILLAAEIVLSTGSAGGSMISLVFGLWLFFVGFNTLEALLPSITVSEAPEGARGTVMGAFSACTFIGAFLGGIIAGAIYTRYESTGVFLFSGIVILIWIAIAAVSRR